MAERRTINRVAPRRRPDVSSGPTLERVRVTIPAPDLRASHTGTEPPTAPRVGPSRAERLQAISDRVRPIGRVALAWGYTLLEALRRLPGRVVAFLVQVPTLAKGSRLTFALLGIALALGCFAGIAAWRPGAKPSNQAFVATGETAAVRAAAVHALTTIDQYQANRMGEFCDRVRGVLTGPMYKEFLRTADATVSFARQSQIDTRALVDPVGVTMLDTRHGRAELLVDLTVSGSRHGAVTTSGQDSLVVRMQKVDGRWLLSDIPDHG